MLSDSRARVIAGQRLTSFGQPLEEREHLSALQLLADDNLAGGIDAVHVEDRFRDVDADSQIAHQPFDSIKHRASAQVRERWPGTLGCSQCARGTALSPARSP